jgi:peptidoglycan-associated lipoprotein
MTKKNLTYAILICLAVLLVFTAGGCCKKKVAPAPPPPPPQVPTANISISPVSIQPGQTATLTWSSTNAQTATLSGIGSVDTSGTKQVSPENTTSYTLKVTGPGGNNEASATLTVKSKTPLPRVVIRVSPTSIRAGETATIQWESEFADEVSIEPGIGKSSASGNTTVKPAQTTTYTAYAKGPGGTSKNSVELFVTPSTPIAELFATSFNDVFFDYDKHQIRPDAQRILQENVQWLKRVEAERGIQIRFRIEGHADERGTTKYNLALGDRRATATRDFLVSLGLPADRIMEVISYGEERPFIQGHDETSWSQNRRAHFVFVP